jgi:hypothetical protein
MVIILNKGNDDTVPEAIEKMINHSVMKVYKDPVLNYVVEYPPFFEKIPDSLTGEFGNTTFRYWNVEKIELSAYIVANIRGLTARQGMDSIGELRKAKGKWCCKDSFILSGPLYWEDNVISDYCYHVKYVKRQKTWFVQEVTYPKECEKSVGRLIRQIDRWKVWDEDKIPKLPFLSKKRKRAVINLSESKKQ